MTAETAHRVTLERVRGFQPPWHTVAVYACAETGRSTRVRVSWRGGAPRGAIVGTCGHVLALGADR